MPFDARRYPANWKAIARAAKEQADWRCAWCGAAHRQPHPVTGSWVVLTTAHLGIAHADGTPGDKHDKLDCRPENLAALCQACHLRFDIDEHATNARRTRTRRRLASARAAGQLPLLEVPEP